MPIETVNDIIEQLADRIGVYGAHCDENGQDCDDKPCRVCWTSELRDRLDAAYLVETQIERGWRSGETRRV